MNSLVFASLCSFSLSGTFHAIKIDYVLFTVFIYLVYDFYRIADTLSALFFHTFEI